MNWIVFLGVLILGLFYACHKMAKRIVYLCEIIEVHNKCLESIGKAIENIIEEIDRLREKK